MPRVSRRAGIVLVLASMLAAGPAFGKQGHLPANQSTHPGIAEAVEEALSSVWHHLTSLWEANGSGLDPFGHPLPSNATSGTAIQADPNQDNGSRLDPFG
jgi:hypothetical protein